MAGLLDSKLVTGKTSGQKVEVDDNSINIENSYSVSAKKGKSVSTLTVENKSSQITYEGGSKTTESNQVSFTERKSAASAPNTDITESRSKSSATYGDGASTVDSASESFSSRSGDYRVDVERSDKIAKNSSGVLSMEEESVTIAKSKQKSGISEYADFKVEELVFDKTSASVSTEKNVWETKGYSELENGYNNYQASALNAEAHASASSRIGTDGITLEAKAGASVSAVETKGSVTSGKVHAEGELSVLNAEATSSASAKVGLDGVEASLNVGVSVSVIEVDGKVTVGDGNLGAELSADAKVLSASADLSAKVGFAKNEKTGEYELNAYVSLEANAVIAEGNVSAEFNVAGVDFGAKVGVYIGAGAKAKVGIEDNKLVVDISAAIGVGVNIKFTIGFNDEFIKNIKWLISYPGIKYASDNPYFKVDTDKLRSYATRINNVNNRLRQLDSDMNSLYWQVGLFDLWDIIVANALISESPTLRNISDYLDDAAERFEAADNIACESMGG